MCNAPITEDTVTARNMLRDLLPCEDFDAMAQHVGFIPSSPDVNYSEHLQSHRRCDTIEPVSGIVAELAESAGNLAAVMASCPQHKDLSEDMIDHYVSISHFAAFAVLMQMVDHGYVTIHAGHRR